MERWMSQPATKKDLDEALAASLRTMTIHVGIMIGTATVVLIVLVLGMVKAAH